LDIKPTDGRRVCVQSAEITDSKTATISSIESRDLVTFVDESSGTLGGIVISPPDFASGDSTQNADLGKFLARPVKIAEFTWADSSTVGTTWSYKPWSLFFNKTSVKNKLANYAFLKCKLKVKIMINASPFLYGAMLAYYAPLSGYSPPSIYYDAYQAWFMPASQLPHRMIYPSENEGCEMELPFIYHKNYLPTTTLAEFDAMGQLDFTNMTLLRSANAAASQSINVAVYAWAEEVDLSGPSTGLVLQAGDEYGDGPISRPASAIADIAGRLKGVPLLGKFATATEIGAGAVSSIARLFGFTNVPVIDNVHPIRPVSQPPLASPEISYPVEKLTLDPKNELAISPSHIGLPDTDELAIEHIVARESWFFTANWTTGNVFGDLLFQTKITPTLLTYLDFSTYQRINSTPMGFVSYLFGNWRGDIILRFRVIASKFHRGRLLISYDPLGTSGSNLITNSSPEGQVFTHIVDISEKDDFEVRIPYQQAYPWLQTVRDWKSYDTTTFGSSASFGGNPQLYNGQLTVRVLTKLTAPVATADVNILCYARGAENLEFANPMTVKEDWSLFSIQSQDVWDEKESEEAIIIGGGPSVPDPHRFRMNMGESVKSLRPLLRRFNLHEVALDSSTTTEQLGQLVHVNSRFPLYYGYDPNGIHSAKGLAVTGSNFPFNFVKNTVFGRIAPAFLGVKGSMFWHINVQAPLPINNVYVARLPDRQTNALRANVHNAAGTGSYNAWWYVQNSATTAAGAALTNTQTNGGITVGVPNYSYSKFQFTKPANTSSPITADGTAYENFAITVPYDNVNGPKNNQITIYKYFSVGTDFNFYMFLCTPSYTYHNVPTPN